MTTLAYRDGTLASDSRVTVGDTEYVGGYKKIYKNERKGLIISSTGSVSMGAAFQEWALRQSFDPITECPLDLGRKGFDIDGVVLIHLGNDKVQVIEYNGGGVINWGFPEFMAWGSGWKIAIGALEAGATAAEAVEIAIRRNVHSGGKLQTLSFNTKAKRKAKK